MGFWVDVDLGASYHFNDDVSEDEAVDKAWEWFNELTPSFVIEKDEDRE